MSKKEDPGGMLLSVFLLFIATAILAARLMFLPAGWGLITKIVLAVVVCAVAFVAMVFLDSYTPNDPQSDKLFISRMYNNSGSILMGISRPNRLVGNIVAWTGLAMVIVGLIWPYLGIIVLSVNFFVTVPFSSVISERWTR